MQEARDALAAIIETPFNMGSDIVHPQSPGLIVRQDNGQRILASMTWGFPLILADAKVRAAQDLARQYSWTRCAGETLSFLAAACQSATARWGRA